MGNETFGGQDYEEGWKLNFKSKVGYGYSKLLGAEKVEPKSRKELARAKDTEKRLALLYQAEVDQATVGPEVANFTIRQELDALMGQVDTKKSPESDSGPLV